MYGERDVQLQRVGDFRKSLFLDVRRDRSRVIVRLREEGEGEVRDLSSFDF